LITHHSSLITEMPVEIHIERQIDTAARPADMHLGEKPMQDPFDSSGRFIVNDFTSARPFSSFLPGIAGPFGIPLWVFYVNRGQAIAAFGVESKNHPIMEFQPANKAYQSSTLLGFRTFVKLQKGTATSLYEPFSPFTVAMPKRTMYVAANELELVELGTDQGLQVNVLYFVLACEPFAALARQVTLSNIGGERLSGELLDGLPAVIPHGVTDALLKNINRTLEAWMAVYNVERRLPFYRLHAAPSDTAEVGDVLAGNFALAYTDADPELLPTIVDPRAVFGADTSFSVPRRFLELPLAELFEQKQIVVGRTPCGFFGTAFNLAPGEALTLSSLFGHARSVEAINADSKRLTRPGYLQEKRAEANDLVRSLTATVSTQTAAPLFDAYCEQNFLDNVMRGGWPVLLGDEQYPFIYHIYSRKHGDLERDYNDYFLAAEFYSQGNGAYRDVNQNRRSEVLLNPQVGDFNIVTLVSLLQADGYNPLVILGSRFIVPPERRASLLVLVDPPELLASILDKPFTPGSLLTALVDHDTRLNVSRDELLRRVLSEAGQHFEAVPAEGYWVDHWTYNLDLIESYLDIYPERQAELLFGKPVYTFYDNFKVVLPRAERYVLAGDRVRQYNAVVEDAEKRAMIEARSEMPNLARTGHGYGPVYRTTLFVKLLCLAAIKFATLDPLGMGIEMEAGKPGWDDAMNGLPGLLGSSMCETYELARLVDFLLSAIREQGSGTADVPVETFDLLNQIIEQLGGFRQDQAYWEAVADAREAYRERIRFGFDGQTRPVDLADLSRDLEKLRARLQAGIERALSLNNGVPPTYFTFDVDEHEVICGADGQPRVDARGRPLAKARRFTPKVLPLFLEGAVHALKLQPDQAAARQLYQQVRASDLFDRKLKMYKVNASLADQPSAIGRARSFTPGWLENESIWLHMEYKYLLETLRAGLCAEFFEDFRSALVPFLDPQVYGRSPLENSSFLVSSSHPDESLHGAGFVARLTGSTAEFISIWWRMMVGARPFFVQDGQLCLRFRPSLPGWLFTEQGTVTFTFLGKCTVVHHNPNRADLTGSQQPSKIVLHMEDGGTVELARGHIGAPYAAQARDGLIERIETHF
ncbi:MAG: hypothetical protein JXB30_16645, partial [Anaerolineae bacterium]|nr:hypothetical protein [Anaerolineae bacterium]